MELAQNRKLAANVERNPNRKMLENRFLLFIEENDAFASLCRSRGINWTEERDIIRSLFLQIKEDELYKEYLSNGESSWEDDKRFIRRLYDAHVVHNEDFHQIYEDKNLHWADDAGCRADDGGEDPEKSRPRGSEEEQTPCEIVQGRRG